MGLLGILGNGAEPSIKVISLEFQPILVENEVIEKAFKLLQEVLVFTNKRLILVNKQGFGSPKVECMSIPYSSIIRFSKECPDLFSFKGELKVWILGEEKPVIKKFKKDININEIYQLLSKFTLNC